MRILVTGAGGMLGRDLVRQGGDIVGLTHAELDILDAGAVAAALSQARADWVINCAAFTRVDACEGNAEAFQLNAVGPAVVAAACRSAGVKMMQISTDYVFGGSASEPYDELSPVNPLNEYGRGKLEGERGAVAAHPDGVWIVRTAWLYGAFGPCFSATMLRLAAEGKPLRVVRNQVGCPTYTHDLAAGLLALIDSGAPAGVYSLVNGGQASWHELAEETIRLAGLTVDVAPINTADWPTAARRPAYSVLSCEKAAGYGVRLRDWHEALAEYVTEAYHEATADDSSPIPWRQ